MTCGCTIDRRCDACVENAFAQLKGVVACRADTWVAELAARRREPWMPWPVDSARVREAAVSWVSDLADDARLRERLIDELVRWAAKRWDEKRRFADAGS